MQIPWNKLSEEALRGLIEEFITREGTEYGVAEVPLERKLEQVKHQLESGDVVIVFDSESGTSNIMLKDEAPH
jgi:uncharacterized protein YheU (UPF0270 family)